MEASQTKPESGATNHVEQLDTDAGASEKGYHLDSIFDDDKEIAEEAIGGASSAELPAGYYHSFPFLGTVFGIWMGEIALFLCASMPFNVLTQINEDLGPNANYIWVSIVVSLSACKELVSSF